MAGPKQKFFGSLSLDGIKKAVVEVSSKVDEHEKYGKQLKVQAAQWDDGAISITLWDAEKKESINLGRLMISKFDDNVTQQPNLSTPEEGDLPF